MPYSANSPLGRSSSCWLPSTKRRRDEEFSRWGEPRWEYHEYQGSCQCYSIWGVPIVNIIHSFIVLSWFSWLISLLTSRLEQHPLSPHRGVSCWCFARATVIFARATVIFSAPALKLSPPGSDIRIWQFSFLVWTVLCAVLVVGNWLIWLSPRFSVFYINTYTNMVITTRSCGDQKTRCVEFLLLLHDLALTDALVSLTMVQLSRQAQWSRRRRGW